MSKLEKAILKVIAFFDLSQKPLTLDEIWHFLHRIQASRIKILIGVQNLIDRGQIGKKDELYFLAGQEKILKTASHRDFFQSLRWKKVEKFAKMFEYAPFVKNVSIVGSLAAGTAGEESDINLLIIAKKHRTFLAKTLVMAILEAFAQNKNRWYRANKFSIDFVLDESKLDLVSAGFKKDTYSAYWLGNLVPVLDRGSYKKLIEENSWILKELPNWQPKDVNARPYRHTFLEKFLVSSFGKSLIKGAKKIQLKNALEYLRRKTLQAEQALLASDSESKRQEFEDRWQKTAKNHPLTKR